MNTSVPLSVCLAIVVIGAVVQLSAQSNVPHHRTSTVQCHKNHKSGRHRHKHSASESKAQKAGEFNGDLRDIPSAKPVRRGTAPVREPKSDPKPYPTPKSNDK